MLGQWQDLIFTAGSVVFILALIPTLRAPENQKPRASTSLITGLTLVVFSATYLTLSLYLSSMTTMITALIWLTIFNQTRPKKCRDEFVPFDWPTAKQEVIEVVGTPEDGKPSMYHVHNSQGRYVKTLHVHGTLEQHGIAVGSRY